MKILAVMGSPHKGNTFEITQRIESKLKEFPDVEFEYIHLKDMDIQPCRGCFMVLSKAKIAVPSKMIKK